ncbi:MAG: aminotransferase class V-fold PLP-dependent enzyme, partial [Cytophagales bacterium]|nr:aminotransferase class V-fold PLP-dependent enzyme [Cytophagales bacterium]
PDRSVVIPSVSFGMANVVHNLPKKKGKIIVVEGQFPSNIYPWTSLKDRGYEVEIVSAPDGIQKGKKWNEKVEKAITEETVLLAIGHVHWADGTLFDLKRFREKLDDVDGLLIIDGTQSVGALPFDIEEIKPDALICAGYKWLMGPYSIGLAYYGKVFDGGKPIEENWINRENSDDFAGLVNYEENYRKGALRYEVGEHSNFIMIPMMIEAIKQVLKWTPKGIQEYCDALMSQAIRQAAELGFESEGREFRATHIFGLQLPSTIEPAKAMRIFKERKVSVSLRGQIIRVAPHVYNDEVDVKKFLRAIKQITDI